MFVDGILIYSSFREEHDAHLQNALYTLRAHRLHAKLSNYKYWLLDMVFIGHVMSSAGIIVDVMKIELVLR